MILRGELAADVGLPAALSLRIPASSGGPAAVAYAAEKKGQLLNLKHERSDAGELMTVRFSVPTRFFQVEFYDRLATATGERNYRYLWPGDLPVNWLDVIVQEPAGASAISVQPALEQSSIGSDGIRYRSAQLGPAKQGTPLPIEIRYAKSDPRTSVEILNLGAPAPVPAASAPPAQSAPYGIFLAMGVTALLAVAACAAYFFWWRRRSRAYAGTTDGGRFCSKCGNRVAAGDRFCAKCGAALGRR
ncbi:MAG: zinc ribbon domain-containing protein [Pseudomonadota bacterium]